ncbi:MAG: FGGY-family carbohydrate kinase [Bacillota bacterium]|nr:FGGY-family carbohydrate kinase [Bacillota bacterium]
MNKNEKYVLTVDCGTQSIRSLIFDSKGTLIIKSKKNFPEYYRPKDTWVEAEVEMFWEYLVDVVRDTKLKKPEIFNKIVGVSVTTQRDTVILLDENYKPLRNAIMWMDTRKTEKPKKMKTWVNILLSLVNFKKIAEEFNKECKAHWLEENEKEIWDKTKKFILLSTYLNYKLTGELKDSKASMIGHIPFDYKKQNWSGKYDVKNQIFQIDRKMLPEVLDPGETLGYITEEAEKLTGIKKGVPLIASGSDKGCETIGTGTIALSSGSISLGSQATIQTTSKKYFELRRLFPPFTAVRPGYFNPEINIYRGYWMVKWFEEEFAHEEIKIANGDTQKALNLLNGKLDKIPPGSEGLILQPFWGKELLRPEARGSIIGFSDKHKKMHIYKAIIEGIGFALLEGIERIEKKSKVKMKKLAISGGGSQSDSICQICADIFDREVYRVQTFETSGLGAAIAVFVGIDHYSDFEEAMKNMIHYKKVFKPNEENAKIYREIVNRGYRKLYKRLKPVYKELEDIQNIK